MMGAKTSIAVLFLCGLHVIACFQTAPIIGLNPERPQRFASFSFDATPSDGAPEARNVAAGFVQDEGRFRRAAYVLLQAGLLGMLSGGCVGIFKLAVEAVAHFSYERSFLANHRIRCFRALIPALGGLIVGLLSLLGSFPPGLKGTIQAVDETSNNPRASYISGAQSQFRSIRKSIAAVITLGTGCSLGPEGPSVEIGMSLSRFVMHIFPRYAASPAETMKQNRLLLACGAAAGVSAGFNAPVAGVFFALEIMQNAFISINKKSSDNNEAATTPSLATTSGNISAVLLSSVLANLWCRALVGEHIEFTVKQLSLTKPLFELSVYILLGIISGGVAFTFSHAAKLSQSLFNGQVGPKRLRKIFRELPLYSKPILGGLFCGLVGLAFPQVLFNGYGTINTLLANKALPTSFLLCLLVLKSTTTAVSAGSGLVGGTFAPALFLGATVGASFHNLLAALLRHPLLLAGSLFPMMAELPTYAMIGSASVLAAFFRSPMTATMLLFELTRDYNVVVPLMASCGVASVVGDILELKQEERTTRRDQQDAAAAAVVAAAVVVSSGDTIF
jgi:H+/Cl- antiporter ClcA